MKNDSITEIEFVWDPSSNGQCAKLRAPRLVCFALAATLAASGLAQSEFHRPLPDYDQKRNALPSNGGMYCVPTAYVDLLRFMALSGLGGLDGSTTNGYNSITSFISGMGNRMDTDAQDGTNFSDGYDAVLDWIDDHSNAGYMHITYRASGNWGTGTIKNWMALGAMVRLGYGRYKREDGEWVRQGGHAIAMAGYDWRGSDKYIYVADPANGDSNLDAQSAFSYDKKLVKNVQFTSEDHGLVTHARYTNWNGDNNDKRAFIDNMHIILPIWGGWINSAQSTETPKPVLWTSLPGAFDDILPQKSTFTAVFPNALNDGVNHPVRELEVDLPGPVKDWCIDTGDVAIYALLQDGTIHHIDLLSKQSRRVTSVKGGRKLAVAGKDFELFALQDGTTQDNLVRIEPATGKQTALKVAKGITAIEGDQSTNGIAALQPTGKRLFKIAPDLRSIRPQTIELPEGDGSVFIGLDRAGEATLARSGARTFVRAGTTGRRFTMVRAPKIRAFEPIGKSRFLVQEDDKLITLDAEGKVVPGPFDNIKADGPIRLAKSWKAFTKAEVSGPKWREVPPGPGEP